MKILFSGAIYIFRSYLRALLFVMVLITSVFDLWTVRKLFLCLPLVCSTSSKRAKYVAYTISLEPWIFFPLVEIDARDGMHCQRENVLWRDLWCLPATIIHVITPRATPQCLRPLKSPLKWISIPKNSISLQHRWMRIRGRVFAFNT